MTDWIDHERAAMFREAERLDSVSRALDRFEPVAPQAEINAQEMRREFFAGMKRGVIAAGYVLAILIGFFALAALADDAVSNVRADLRMIERMK